MKRPFEIIRLHHVELYVTDLDRSREFYIKGLGFTETEYDGEHSYLRAIDDANHHCLTLTKANQASLNHIAYRVSADEDLDHLAKLFNEQNLPFRWLDKGEERAQGRAIRIQDPVLMPVEFFFEMEKAERLLQKFDQHRGGRVKRIDHVNCLVQDIDLGYEWYKNNLGFMLSEYTVSENDNDESLWAAWMHRKPGVHDLAMIREVGPRHHHTGFWVDDAKSIFDACDTLASQGYFANIERSPGRHGTSNAIFVYYRDPDGHRIELYTGDYFTNDPDFEPLKWYLSDPQRATFWGAEPPASWKTEAMPVQHILTGKLMEVEKPVVNKNVVI